KWNANSLFSGFIDLNIPISETGQRLEIGPLLTNTPDSHYRGIRSVNTYNFTGSYCYVELVQPAPATTKADAMFTVGNDVNNYYRLYVSEGTLYGLRKIGGSKTTLFSLPYDPVNHRFLRIRHQATGSVTLDTAPANGETPGTWVQRYSEIWSSSISLTATIFELKGGTWQPEGNAPGKVIFDNFRFGSNSGSPPLVTAISPNSGSINGGTLVNITGSRFTSGATVSLGGSLATNITVMSSSFIIATTSAHSAGTVNVVVTNPDGQSGTFANAYTYSSAPPPQTGLLADDFNDNLLDTAKWNPNSLFSGFIDLSIPISETGQRLEIGPLLTNTPDSHYRGIRSVNTYNFTGSYCYVELVQSPSSTTKADAMFTVGNDVNNYYRLYVSEGMLYGLRKIGGSKTTLFSLPYDPVNHRFLRIRHEATGGVTLDTAPGSGETPGTWVQRYSEIWSSSISLTATIFELKGGTWQPEGSAPGKVIFDNFRFGSNSGSPPTVNAVSPNSGSINGGTLLNITGSRFASGATVSLGGSLATNVTVMSSSFIIATTSAHSAGTVNVVVTNPDGQSGTFANAYTYSSAPPPQTGLLADDFNDNLLDTAKWNPNSLFSGFIDLSIPISETGQRLEIGP